MPAIKKEINLLPKEPWEKGFLGNLIHWVLSVGRYVVVFTELIVISSFLYRFSLDKKLADLNEKIKQEKTVVESYGDFEDKFRQVQKQLEEVKIKEDESIPIGLILNTISEITPTETVYESITINNQVVELQGRVLSEVGLATLLTQAQARKEFSDINLENVTSGKNNSQEINFQMTLTLAKK
ncbi:MAG: PilN domain-containing protein [Candidatus Beckwithbacteria bacterium]|nr:PilN domain-containing protein [Candidatus Beckwithbacteria bacterium]